MTYAESILSARQLIESRLSKRGENFDGVLRSLKIELINSNFGSWYVGKMRAECITELERRAAVIFNALEETLNATKAWSADLSTRLGIEFDGHFNKEHGKLSIYLESAKKGERYFQGFTLREAQLRLSQEYHARINMFSSKLATADRQRDFDSFGVSAKGEASTRSFQEWAGGEQVTLAIVFTDVVGSTALGEEIRDESMNEVRRAHFAQSRRLIGQFQGREIKTIGDSFMAAFKCAGLALDYARALQGNTGHPQVQIRACIHIGPMRVEEGDVFGSTVNFAARVVGTVKDAEIWLSERAKEDIDWLGTGKHKHLKWERHEDVAMKGFPGKWTLWAVAK